MGCFVAFVFLWSAHPQGLSWEDCVVLGASAGSALMVAMPGASRATALLHKVDISTDAGLLEEFAQQEYAKQSIPFCIKYGPSVRLLAVALVAAA